MCKLTDMLPMKAHEFSFGLGGVIVPSEAVQELSASTLAFCERWNVPALHGSKIRAGKGKFGFLKEDKVTKAAFMKELEDILVDDRITAHACVICRPGYRDRYHQKHPEGSRWQMSRTAFDISVERAVKFARSKGRKLSVVYERSGEKEDRLIENYFQRLKTVGTEFDVQNSSPHQPLTREQLAESLLSIWPDGKVNPMLQLADLTIAPLCHKPTGRPNRAYERLIETGQIIDARTDDPTIAVKYSCYDGPYEKWEDPEKT